MPLLTSLLEKDTLIERKLFKLAFNLRNLPTSQQVSNIRGILRVPALHMVRNIMSHNLARTIHFRLESSDLVTRQLAQRDVYIILQRSPYDLLREERISIAVDYCGIQSDLGRQHKNKATTSRRKQGRQATSPITVH